MSRGSDVIKFIQKYCHVPEGQFVGQPLRLLPFQKGTKTNAGMNRSLICCERVQDGKHQTDDATIYRNHEPRSG